MPQTEQTEIKRLTATEFINKVREAPAWQLRLAGIFNEPLLSVQWEKDGLPEVFLGPHPLETPALAYISFMYSLEAWTKPDSELDKVV